MSSEAVKQQLLALGDPQRAKHAVVFFKTGEGQYGEGDRFIGCKVSETRRVARENKGLELSEVQKLLDDVYHDCRLCALVILTLRFKKASEEERRLLVDFYLANTHRVNSWDLVDISAYHILGEWLKDKDRSLLYQLAISEKLWEQRIAMLATMAFIKDNDFADTLRLSELFLSHPHDLIHKACGWMLREVGKRDVEVLTDFLERNATLMPRTMLRYAIEKLTPTKRTYFLRK